MRNLYTPMVDRARSPSPASDTDIKPFPQISYRQRVERPVIENGQIALKGSRGMAAPR